MARMGQSRMPPGSGLPRLRRGPFGIAVRSQGPLGAATPDTAPQAMPIRPPTTPRTQRPLGMGQAAKAKKKGKR